MSKQIVDFLNEEYNKRKQKNSAYSLRAFSNLIGMEHSTLSKIMNSKRALTFEAANKILTALKIDVPLKNTLLLTIADSKNMTALASDENYVILTEDELNESYKWYFYAILSALEIKKCKPTVLGISDFIDLDIDIVQGAVDILIKLNSIKVENNQLSLTYVMFSSKSSSGISNALVKAHLDHIDYAYKVLESLKDITSETDYSGITMAIPIKKIPEAKRRIKEFRRSLALWLSDDADEKDHVYRINIQLFPLGKNVKSK